jgi:hypothetical protein
MTIARAIVLHGGGNAMVPECASDQGEIHVFRHEIRGERVFQDFGVSLLPGQTGRIGNGPEYAEELHRDLQFRETRQAVYQNT